MRKQKENDISAHAAVHSKIAYDDAGEYGRGPEQKYRRELSVNHKQAQSRLVPSSLQVRHPIEGQSFQGRFLLGVPCFRNWSDLKPLRVKNHLEMSFRRDRLLVRSGENPEISRQNSAATHMNTVAFMLLRKSKPQDPVPTEEVECNETCRHEWPIAHGTASQKNAHPILRNPAAITYHSRAW